ncbi:hypothetical protein QAD02_002040 [Eretmocerus hayati]|uniref:Uncharacterized protein n=1 Tax=Eretmocerus hayati TaxID=131215 RepID=A0ACC2NJH0_9HYME|nr:hypothetical protein QAD02_002040 [Eretmocerus hayati]
MSSGIYELIIEVSLLQLKRPLLFCNCACPFSFLGANKGFRMKKWNAYSIWLMGIRGPKQLVYNVPVIHFKLTEPTRKKTNGMYSCPCYYYPQRSGDEGRPAFVVTVDLNAGAESAAFWTKRGTALLLSLSP